MTPFESLWSNMVEADPKMGLKDAAAIMSVATLKTYMEAAFVSGGEFASGGQVLTVDQLKAVFKTAEQQHAGHPESCDCFMCKIIKTKDQAAAHQFPLGSPTYPGSTYPEPTTRKRRGSLGDIFGG